MNSYHCPDMPDSKALQLKEMVEYFAVKAGMEELPRIDRWHNI